MLTPYVSTMSFVAHPTYLDLDDLRSGDDSGADQTAALNDLLLMASRWADNRAGNMPLAAHQYTQNLRTSADRYGQVKIHPDHIPFISMTSFGYGYTPTSLTTLANPSVWPEDDRNLVVTIGATGMTSWAGSLQFGTPAAGSRLYTQSVLLAGYVATVLGGAADQGDTSITVTDPTGIVPGGEYRIWEPGSEEYVTVATTYTPAAVTVPLTPTSIPLASPLLNDHASGHDFSGMPEDLRLAVINYAVSQLMRPDTAAEDSYPDTKLDSGTRQDDPRKDASGLVAEAERIISTYARRR